MTIQSDKWITEQCVGRRYNWFSKDSNKDMISIAENVPIEYFRFDDVKEHLELLQLGEEYKPDEITVITLATNGTMITPFVGYSCKEILFEDQSRTIIVPSFGLSSYGYDIRLGNTFKTMSKAKAYHSLKNNIISGEPSLVNHIIDPANLEALDYETVSTGRFVLEPHGFALGVSMEHLEMPEDVLAICMGKSSCARYGLSAQITPIEPGWKGYITIELFNMTDKPMYLYAGQGIMQLLFMKGNPCNTTYADRSGKYQDQPAEPVSAR